MNQPPYDDELRFDKIKAIDPDIGDDENEADVIFRILREFVSNDQDTQESEQ